MRVRPEIHAVRKEDEWRRCLRHRQGGGKKAAKPARDVPRRHGNPLRRPARDGAARGRRPQRAFRRRPGGSIPRRSFRRCLTRKSGSARGAFAPRAGRMLAPSRTLQVSTLDFVHRVAKTTLDFVQFAYRTTLVLDLLNPNVRPNSPFHRARNRLVHDIQNSDIQPCEPPGRRRRSSSTTSAANAIAPRRETSSHLTIGHSLIWKCVRLSNEDASRNSSPRPLAKQISYFTKRTLRNRSTTPPLRVRPARAAPFSYFARQSCLGLTTFVREMSGCPWRNSVAVDSPCFDAFSSHNLAWFKSFETPLPK